MLAIMDAFKIPIELLQLAGTIVFASPEPVAWQRLAPMLPRDLDPGMVFSELERYGIDPSWWTVCGLGSYVVVRATCLLAS